MKQGYNDRLDEALGMRRGHREGKSHQSLASRRHESEGMEEHYGKRKFSGAKTMDRNNKSKSHSKNGSKNDSKKHYTLRGPGDYDRSAKHRKRESEGMKRYWRDK